jgi:hypothetical protein
MPSAITMPKVVPISTPMVINDRWLIQKKTVLYAMAIVKQCSAEKPTYKFNK